MAHHAGISIRWLLLAALVAGAVGQVSAQSLSGTALVEALQKGGYVLVMRHAASPREVPDAATANPDNVKRERQLDETGRTTAAAMGRALRTLGIPIGDVLTSPTYRALETIRLLEVTTPTTVDALGDNGQSMQAVADAQAAWLQKQVTQFPKATNTLLVTHMPNIARAFPQAGAVADGETLVFGPDRNGAARIAGRIKIDEWARLRR